MRINHLFRNLSRTVTWGMAKCRDEEKIPEIGEFCCTTNFVKFHVFNLRQHVERSRVRLDTISEGSPRINQIVRYLTFVRKTLTSVEEELKDKGKYRNFDKKEKRRHQAGTIKALR